MLTNEEYENIIEIFVENEVRAVRHLLQFLERNPSKDNRLLPYIENCLSDDRICILWAPIMYGMIKWQAAQTLRTEYKACNIMKPIVLNSVFEPIRSAYVTTLRIRTKICNDQNDIECIESLIKAEYIKLYTIKYPAGV